MHLHNLYHILYHILYHTLYHTLYHILYYTLYQTPISRKEKVGWNTNIIKATSKPENSFKQTQNKYKQKRHKIPDKSQAPGISI